VRERGQYTSKHIFVTGRMIATAVALQKAPLQRGRRRNLPDVERFRIVGLDESGTERHHDGNATARPN
jgi:hypothetical protein